MLKIILVTLVSTLFMTTGQAQELPEPIKTIDVSPSWVASGSREVMYASSSVRHVLEVNVPNFKTEALCDAYVQAQQSLAIENSSRGNLGTQVFSATCSKQR